LHPTDTGGRTRPEAQAAEPAREFLPVEPASFKAAGLSETQIEALVLKFLLARGDAAGRAVSEHLRLPFALLDPLLRRLKDERVLTFRDGAALGDFVYRLTEPGIERARSFAAANAYFGAAPVPLADYLASVAAQSLQQQHPTELDLRRAFRDLVVEPEMLDLLGPAVNAGRGLFLHGAAGNGKTSLAERITRAFGRTIWIPRVIDIDGEALQLFDPLNHVEAALAEGESLPRHDQRWVRIERPTIVVGGELTAEHLEVSVNAAAGIAVAPVQLKSNCGTLVIDDFGRQRIGTTELLNRWIVPLEKQYDFLSMPSGKKIQVPFDQLIVFSTNLHPRDVASEAFLRRIPYKIEVTDPSEQEYRDLAQLACERLGLTYAPAAIDRLIARHYSGTGRPFRRCEPRDLLAQVVSYCQYRGEAPHITAEYLDLAASAYFV
jgi:hypothetical protein